MNFSGVYRVTTSCFSLWSFVRKLIYSSVLVRIRY